jgi:hypothetical protein
MGWCDWDDALMRMIEKQYQALLINKLKDMFSGCVILKNDSTYQQGIPDLIILWHDYWASLEVKAAGEFHAQPNQVHFIEKLDEMSFAAFIFPENEEEVLNALQQAFEAPRRTRVSQS